MMLQSKVAEGTRLTWVCRIVNHWFRWVGARPQFEAHEWHGTCLICGAKRRIDLYWPAPPPRKDAA